MNIFEEEAGNDGITLVRTLLSTKKIYIPLKDFSFEDGKHSVKGVAFSEEIRQDEGLKETLKEKTGELIRLFYAAEHDERLHVPKEEIGGTVRPYFRGEPVTGMTFLNLFSLQLLRLSENGESIEIHPLLLKEFPGVQKLCAWLLEDLSAFKGTENGRSGKTEISPREAAVRSNVNQTLTVLKDMMEELDRNAAEALDEDLLAPWTFENGNYTVFNGFRVEIPDGFFTENEEKNLILYRPNPENPKMSEASLLRFSLEKENGYLSVRAFASVTKDREKTEKLLEDRLRGHIFG